MLRKASFFVLIAFGVLLSGCGKYQKLLKSTDNEMKYERAVEYYQRGDYYRAEQLFDQLIPVFRGTEKAEMIYYYSAYAYYEQKEYLLASYYFKRFSKNFPRSQYAEECSFMSAYCKFLDSPKASLDQTNTYEAINELQLFTNLYPASPRVEECNRLIDELRSKLEEKAFGIANLYFRMEEYKAAVTTYRNLLKDFPGSRYREEAMLNIFKSMYFYAERSVPSKQQERFRDALDAYNAFVASYPESRFIKSIRNLRDNMPVEVSSAAI